MNKNYKVALDEAAQVTESENTYPVGALSVAFKRGADFAFNYQQAKIDKLAEALKEINKEELSSQRPGGGYSRSAILSYETLAQYEQFKKDSK